MRYELRDYQAEASRKAVEFFHDDNIRYNAVEVLACGAGKSLILADIASKLNDKVLIFQPNAEILRQNYEKYCSYGLDNAAIYSASLNSKEVRDVTFATIGSAKNHSELFTDFKYICIDECQLVNPKEGMYSNFLKQLKCKVLGVTATPYRLDSQQGIFENGRFMPNGTYDKIDYFKDDFEPKPGVIVQSRAIEKIITRTRPRVFEKIIYHVQTKDLMDRKFLERPIYFDVRPKMWCEGNLFLNSTGLDYTDESVKKEYKRVDIYARLVTVVRHLLNPKDGNPRHGILVFTRFVEEADRLASEVPSCKVVKGTMGKKERKQVIDDFKNGKIKVLANANCLAEGFDYPELDTVVMARPTRSMAKYGQIVGRAMRKRADGKPKIPWFVDMCGNIDRFGKIEEHDIIDFSGNGRWEVMFGNKQLTNIYF